MYYTKLRPYLKEFLESISQIYELHIFTFGCREYAHKIASIIDPDKKYFGNRILSRNESVDQYSKWENLNNLFPCGDAMVCIIDDRADVWKDAGNLIQVKPYSYFKTSISDGAPRDGSPNTTAAEDEEALDRDLDKLEDLLGLDEDERSDKDKLKMSEQEDLDDFLSPDPVPSGHTLPSLLKHIHDKWYMELDEHREFLVDGESYKLPDIKDIIKRYLRRKF